jgi:hypothetical protein
MLCKIARRMPVCCAKLLDNVGMLCIPSLCGDLPIGEDIREAEMLMVFLAVQIQKVGHVNVGDAEGICLVPRPT